MFNISVCQIPSQIEPLILCEPDIIVCQRAKFCNLKLRCQSSFSFFLFF